MWARPGAGKMGWGCGAYTGSEVPSKRVGGGGIGLNHRDRNRDRLERHSSAEGSGRFGDWEPSVPGSCSLWTQLSGPGPGSTGELPQGGSFWQVRLAPLP